MDLKFEAVQMAALLLPGFLSVQIRDALAPSRARTDFERFMEALAFSVAAVATVLGIGLLASGGGSDLDQSILISDPSSIHYIEFLERGEHHEQ